MSGEGLQVAPRGLHLPGPGPVAPAGCPGCGWPRSHMHLVGLLWGRGCHRTARATWGGPAWATQGTVVQFAPVPGGLWAEAVGTGGRGCQTWGHRLPLPSSCLTEGSHSQGEERHGEGRDEGTGREEAMRKKGRVRCGRRRWTGPGELSMDSGRGEGGGAETRPCRGAFRQS